MNFYFLSIIFFGFNLSISAQNQEDTPVQDIIPITAIENNLKDRTTITSHTSMDTTLSSSSIFKQTIATISGDFNGDGKMDSLIYPTTGTSSKATYCFFSNFTSVTSPNIAYEHSVGLFDEIFPVFWKTMTNKLMPNQGWTVIKTLPYDTTTITTFTTYSTGITRPIYLQNEKKYEFQKIHFINNKDCKYYPPSKEILNGLNETTYLDIPKKYLSGDFNGDGLTDIVAIEKPLTYTFQDGCNEYTTTRSGGNSFFINLDPQLTKDFVRDSGIITSNGDSEFMLADFNGDGKTDIYVVDSGSISVYTLHDSKYFFMLYQNTTLDANLNLTLKKSSRS